MASPDQTAMETDRRRSFGIGGAGNISALRPARSVSRARLMCVVGTKDKAVVPENLAYKADGKTRL